MTREKLKRLKNALDRLDNLFINNPGKEVSEIETRKSITSALNALDRIVFSFIRGGNRRHPMRRTGNGFLNWLNRNKYALLKLLDKLDTKFCYSGKSVRTSSGIRVRSKAERRIAELLDSCCIPYRYEHPITIDGIKLHPDFFLPNEDVYIEFWGMPRYGKYYRTMKKKKHLYSKHGIKVIHLYPKDMSKLEKRLATLYKEATGVPLPCCCRGLSFSSVRIKT